MADVFCAALSDVEDSFATVVTFEGCFDEAEADVDAGWLSLQGEPVAITIADLLVRSDTFSTFGGLHLVVVHVLGERFSAVDVFVGAYQIFGID